MRPRRLGGHMLVLAAAALVTASPGRSAAQPEDVPPPVFRVFLKDGSSLASYGEYTRIGDRVVFSTLLGHAEGLPRLQAASVPVREVDWPETERYAASLKAERYFATRARADFEVLTDAVQKLLDELAKTDDVGTKLAVAERIRNALAAWPAEHHGYRSDDVRTMLALADDVVSELQTSTEGQQFSLALVAIPEPPPRASLLPVPTLQESIEQVLRLTGFAASPSERVLLLEAAHQVLERDRDRLPGGWRDKTLVNVERTLNVEEKTTRNYADLRDRAMARLGRLSAESNVRGIERLIADVRRRDQRMGQQRPDMIGALVATLEGRLAQVSREREEREQAAARRKALEQYLRAVETPLADCTRVLGELTEIRSGNLLTPARSEAVTRRLAQLSGALRAVEVPPAAAATHAAFSSAVTLSQHAVALRSSGTAVDPVQTLRDASAAAAGALLLFERVRIETRTLVARPDDPAGKP